VLRLFLSRNRHQRTDSGFTPLFDGEENWLLAETMAQTESSAGHPFIEGDGGTQVQVMARRMK
jgi:hypothetical protein